MGVIVVVYAQESPTSDKFNKPWTEIIESATTQKEVSQEIVLLYFVYFLRIFLVRMVNVRA